LQHGFVIIPTSSSSKGRQRENYDILDFALTAEEMQQLDELDNDRDDPEKGDLFAKLDAQTRYWPIDEEEVDLGDVTLAAKMRAAEIDEQQEF
jgi:hypothetical protein